MAWTWGGRPAAADSVDAEDLVATTSGGAGDVEGTSALRQLLTFFFAAYIEESTDIRKRRMSAVLLQADALGLIGAVALAPLKRLLGDLRDELMDPTRFAAFYHFVFFIARERGIRNMTADTAAEAWRFVLADRFRHLDHWCAFVLSNISCRRGVTEDTWCQLLDFVHAVKSNLSNYDPHGAWPTLLDEFVDERRKHPSDDSVVLAVTLPETTPTATTTTTNDCDDRACTSSSSSTVMANSVLGGDAPAQSVGCKRRISVTLMCSNTADIMDDFSNQFNEQTRVVNEQDSSPVRKCARIAPTQAMFAHACWDKMAE